MPNDELREGDKVFGFDPMNKGKKFISFIKRIEGKYAILAGCPGEGCCPLEELKKCEDETEPDASDSCSNS